MALSSFSDKSHPPADEDLRSVLGTAHDAWARLIEVVTARVDQLLPVWGFTSEVTGWGLRLKRKDRVILYMTPRKGHFLVSFALGEKAITAGRSKGLPKEVLSALDAAPKYTEGRGVRLKVAAPRDLRIVQHLLEIKVGRARSPASRRASRAP